ncbi:hypothetical protein [Flavobacterium piscinae]|uniref:hypothetical protein n=1 Tax=Flavobacterium piscinae TaxID=2506424 RepID=UPI002AABA45D|nr:hypothetical protein [Flavobacterium piscinae]
METSKRFNEAVNKLYKAFHENNLKPLSFQHCAVGTILDHKTYWKEFSDANGDLQLNYVGLVHQRLERKFNGYSPLELLEIEKRSCKPVDINCHFITVLFPQKRKAKRFYLKV